MLTFTLVIMLATGRPYSVPDLSRETCYTAQELLAARNTRAACFVDGVRI